MKKRQGSDWSAVREWTNVAIAGSALLVAIVSFWTTTRISGLEDYLKSEVTRRNSELNGLSSRSEQAQKIADDSRSQLVHLQSSTTAAITESVAAYRRLSETRAQLQRVQSNVAEAQIYLLEARVSAQKLKADFAQQTDQYDLLRRQQTYESFVFAVAFEPLLSRDKVLTGADFVVLIRSHLPDSNRRVTMPYFDRVHSRVGSACSELQDIVATLPPKAGEPAKPTITYMSNASKEEIAHLTRIAQDKWAADFNKYIAAMRARSDAEIAATGRMTKEANRCVCVTLADEKFGMDQICPDVGKQEGTPA